MKLISNRSGNLKSRRLNRLLYRKEGVKMEEMKHYLKDVTTQGLLNILTNDYQIFGNTKEEVVSRCPQSIVDGVLTKRKVILEILLERI